MLEAKQVVKLAVSSVILADDFDKKKAWNPPYEKYPTLVRDLSSGSACAGPMWEPSG